LDECKRRHDAAVETEDGTTAFRRNYRGNIAAYELDKLLDLRLVVPSVLRVVDGRQAAVTWWVDAVAMMESDRRARKVEPPDAEAWNNEMAVVRVFDELISNAYRGIDSGGDGAASGDDGPPPSYKWTELLITSDWRVWLIDHTGAFRIRRELQHPDSLTRCDRALLARLRALNRNAFEQRLVPYLTPAQLDALEARRVLLVKHVDEEIARRGEKSVLYDRGPSGRRF